MTDAEKPSDDRLNRIALVSAGVVAAAIGMAIAGRRAGRRSAGAEVKDAKARIAAKKLREAADRIDPDVETDPAG